jgi:hypothetical protein
MVIKLPLLFFLAAGMSIAGQPGSNEATPILSEKTYECWRTYILPKPFELTWQSYPWHSKIEGAMAEARKKDKPLLVWVMDGHPLGNC